MQQFGELQQAARRHLVGQRQAEDVTQALPRLLEVVLGVAQAFGSGDQGVLPGVGPGMRRQEGEIRRQAAPGLGMQGQAAYRGA